MASRMSLSLLLSCHLALLRFCAKYSQPRRVLARPSSAWHLTQCWRYSCWPSTSASAGRLALNANTMNRPSRTGLFDIGQVSFEGDARHDRASVAFILLAVLVLDVLVVAGQVDHGIGTCCFGRVLEADQCGLQGPAAGGFIALVECVGLLAGGDARLDHADRASWFVASQVELHAAVEAASVEGFLHDSLEWQKVGGVTRLADGREQADAGCCENPGFGVHGALLSYEVFLGTALGCAKRGCCRSQCNPAAF